MIIAALLGAINFTAGLRSVRGSAKSLSRAEIGITAASPTLTAWRFTLLLFGACLDSLS